APVRIPEARYHHCVGYRTVQTPHWRIGSLRVMNLFCRVCGVGMATEAEPRIVELQRRMLGGYELLQALVGIRLRSVTDPDSRRHLTWLSDVTAAVTLLNRRITAAGPIDFSAYLSDASQ